MDNEEYERLRQKQVSSYNPKLRSIAHIQDDMREVLSSSTMNPDEKMRLFQSLFVKSKEIQDNGKFTDMAPVEKNLLPKPVAQLAKVEGIEETSADADESHKILKDYVLDSVATTVKGKAHMLLDYLNRHKSKIHTNDNFELVLNGKTIEGTNFVDLVHSLYSNAKKFQGLPGKPEFLKQLSKLNIPASMMITSASFDEVKNLPKSPKRSRHNSAEVEQKGEGKHNRKRSGKPPGKKPKFLHLYRI